MSETITPVTAQDAERVLRPRRRAFEQAVLRPLGCLRRRLRFYQVIDGLASTCAMLLVASVVQFGLDRTLRLQVDMRALLLLAVLAAVGVTAWRALVAPLRAHVSTRDLALLVERRTPAPGSRLVSAVEFVGALAAREPDWSHRSPTMVRALLGEVEAEAAGLPWTRVLDHRRAARRAGLVLGCLLVGVVAAGFGGETARLWFQRNVLLHDVAWPQQTRLIVEDLPDGVIRCARGDDCTLAAHVADGFRVPRQVFVEYETEAGDVRRAQMSRIGRAPQFERVFERVSESMRCRISGGDDRTDWFTVEVVDRPAVAEVIIGVEPPAYTRAAAYTLRPGLTVAEVLKGSQLRFQIRTNKPVREAHLVRGVQPAEQSVERLSELEWVVTDRPETSAGYHFELTDALGLTNRSERARPLQITVQLVADKPPRVKLTVGGVSDLITPAAVLPIQVECSDTYGLAAAELVQESTRHTDGPRIAPIRGVEPHSTTSSQSFAWPLAPLGLLPTDRLSLYAQARDYDDVSGPNVGTSAILSLRVVSREQLLEELTRREQQQRQEFERLVRAQEDLYAELLTVLQRIGEGAAAEEHRRSLAALARVQRQQMIRTEAVRRRLEQVLQELDVNGVLTPAVRERLGGQIVEPIGRLVRTAMPEALSRLSRLAQQDDPAERAALRPEQARLLETMRTVLAAMLKYEGFQEIVSLLRDIVELQGSVTEDTDRQLAEDIESIFGPSDEKKND
ncbi:MAG: hypothetical protein JXA69_18300 [Phycisphaerae bacterium]|nr:hypothetical protein [Phycisphaerae bacterium]